MRHRNTMGVLTTLLSSVLMIAGVVALSSGARAAAVDRQFAPQATGAFTGQVTAEDGTTPLSGINVRAYQQTGPESWLLVDTVQTAGDGTYTVNGLDADIYRAKFEDPAGDYVSEYYDDRDTFTFATNFEVADGGTTTGIDAALAQAGHIAGTVTVAGDNTPIEDIIVSAWYSTTSGWQRISDDLTALDGTYDIGSLSAGNYRVRFADVYEPPRYAEEVYDNAATLDDGMDVAVSAGSTTSGIDAVLGEYGRITGHVYGPDGSTPLDEIYVDVYISNTTKLLWDWVNGRTTDSNGAYDIPGLETGDYRVAFTDPDAVYEDEVYDNQPSLDAGDDVHVDFGFETSNIDAVLDLAPQPFTVYGTVKVNGANVKDGTPVVGWCNGVLQATSPAVLSGGHTEYSLEIPADGCSAGQVVTFTIDGLLAQQSTTWIEGGSEQVNLTTFFGVTLRKQVSPDGLIWHDADIPADTLMIDAGAPLTWRIAITNTSAVTVGILLTDVVNDTMMRSLPSVCDVAPPDTLGPMEDSGASYTCLIEDTAQAGSYHNVVSATIFAGGWSDTEADSAHVFGIKRGMEIQKRVSDGVTWYDADGPEYPSFTEETNLTWQIAVTNTGNVTVSLSLTDTLNGLPIVLSDVCSTSIPAMLPPDGTNGAVYICDFADTAALGFHRNVVTATATYAGSYVTAFDEAGYRGTKADQKVFLPLVLR